MDTVSTKIVRWEVGQNTRGTWTRRHDTPTTTGKTRTYPVGDGSGRPVPRPCRRRPPCPGRSPPRAVVSVTLVVLRVGRPSTTETTVVTMVLTRRAGEVIPRFTPAGSRVPPLCRRGSGDTESVGRVGDGDVYYRVPAGRGGVTSAQSTPRASHSGGPQRDTDGRTGGWRRPRRNSRERHRS